MRRIGSDGGRVRPSFPSSLLLCAALTLAGFGQNAAGQALSDALNALPDSPGALLASARSSEASLVEAAAAAQTTAPSPQPQEPCRSPAPGASQTAECRSQSALQSFVSKPVAPLTVKQKGRLAVRDVVDPFNLITIAGYSGIAIASNAHSPYGPGFAGWGRLSGYGLLEDSQGEFFGAFVIPSIAHQDPRYHRMPNAPVRQRIFHALAHTWVSQHDDGRPMPNYATLLTYPISAELANLYVPGIQGNAPATARRVAIGLATDPSGTVVAEFLPDVARRIHIHIIFVQEILNQVISGGTAPNVQ